MLIRRSLRFSSTKVMASAGGNLVKNVEKPQFSTNSMVMGERTGNSIKSNTMAKKGKSKTFLSLGSLGAYVRMREKSKENEQLSNIDVVLKEPNQARNILLVDQPMESSWKRQASYSQMQQLGLLDVDDGFESSDDYAFDEEKDAAPEQLEKEVVEIINESIALQDNNLIN